MKETVAFDDVLLVPVYSEAKSRLDVSTETCIAGMKLDVPLISSPMDTVTEQEMALQMSLLGGLGILHRFCDVSEQIRMIRDLLLERVSEKNVHKKENFPYIVPAIGVGESSKIWLDTLIELGFAPDIDALAIDVANGHNVLMKEMVEYVRGKLPDMPIIAGNVATGEGFAYLAELGVNAVRVGIGGGSICKTRIQTGFGVPTLESVMWAAEARERYGYDDVSIIADGGIKYPADLVKSLAAGADAIICGSVFAGTKEAPGDVIIDNNGKAYKKYRGMASEEVQNEKRGGLKPGTVAEGVSTLTPYKGSLNRVINEFVGGLRSGMTYANASTIKELQLNSRFIKISQSGILESHAYGTKK